MLVIQRDSDGTRHAIATGRVVGRFKTYKNKNGFTETEFTMCVKSDHKAKNYQTLKVCAYGDYPNGVVHYAKLKKEVIIAYGNCSIDTTMTELRGENHYSMYANALICPSMIFDIYSWHQNSMQIDKILSKEYEQNIRYDYEDEPNIEDHMI